MYVHSLGHFHPENTIDNAFLESLDIGTDDEWILTRTGIRTRRTVLPLDYIATTRNRDPRASDEVSLYTNAETGFLAAKMAIERAGLTASDIGMVVAGGSAPRMGSPAEACLIADRLGLSVPSFDINSACTTYAAQLHLLSKMPVGSLPDFVLIVNPENLTRTVDYSDRGNAVLMGDGTTATIVSNRVPAPLRVTGTMMQSDPSGWNKVTIPSRGHLKQDGNAVQNFAIRKTIAVIDELRRSAQPGFRFIGHQANLPMLRSVCMRAGLDDARHIYNVDEFGNCGAAGAPGVISQNFESLVAGDELLMALVGSGLTWAGVLFKVL